MLHIAMIVTMALLSLLGPSSSAPAQTEGGGVDPAYVGDVGPSCSNVGDPGVAYCTVLFEHPDGTCTFSCKSGTYHPPVFP